MNQNKIKLAVVDDDESFASALERRFRLLGLEVTTYPSAEAFLASTTLPRPGCLVLDIQLGGMSGLDLQRRLGELGARAPIIFVTAHDSPAMRKEAQQAKDLLNQLRESANYERMTEKLAVIQRKIFDQEKGPLPMGAAPRIDAMILQTREIMQKYLQDTAERDLEQQVNELEASGASPSG